MKHDLQIPNLGTNSSVDVVEILVKVGDVIEVDTPICVVESEKSSFDIVSLYQGTILSLELTIGQKMSSGQSFGIVSAQEPSAPSAIAPILPPPVVAEPAPPKNQQHTAVQKNAASPTTLSVVYASPLVRKLARLNNISLNIMQGTGAQGRITVQDLQQKLAITSAVSALPAIDSLPDKALWGTVTEQPLSKIQKVAGQRFQRAWSHIPHVTHFDIANVTSLEAIRQKMNAEGGVKLTLLGFVIQALAQTLKQFPIFNSSLSSCGQHLLVKSEIHIGCAVETTQGLLVPVLRNTDRASVKDIGAQLITLAQKARALELKPQDYQGQTFTVSSLGSHGGRFFTPIIQWPDVAILGVCKTYHEPCLSAAGHLENKLSLPLSLSYDHRVIDGGAAAKFMGVLIAYLENPQSLPS